MQIKRVRHVKRWFLIAGAAVLAVVIGLWLRGGGDTSIEVGERFGKVENGAAYDAATVDLTGVKKLILPQSATIRPGGGAGAGTMRIYMVKTLSFYGHPPEPMSIRDARDNMGCAVKKEGDALMLATFGEWDSRIEGGASMKLIIEVPGDLPIEQRDDLAGTRSAASQWHGQYLTKAEDAKGGYWYGPASPSGAWGAVADEPDSARTAK